MLRGGEVSDQSNHLLDVLIGVVPKVDAKWEIIVTAWHKSELRTKQERSQSAAELANIYLEQGQGRTIPAPRSLFFHLGTGEALRPPGLWGFFLWLERCEGVGRCAFTEQCCQAHVIERPAW